MLFDVSQFSRFPPKASSPFMGTISGDWPENLSGHIFIIGPHHRKLERHLFVGTGEVTRWDLKKADNQIQIHSSRLKTWDSFWQNLLPWTWRGGFFPASMSLIGIGELANTAILKLKNRVFLTADAGRFWEIDPVTLETITPVGYFDEHLITAPGIAFPMIMNTAHSFYDPHVDQVIGCELKARPRISSLFSDMVAQAFITRWDGKSKIHHWQLDGVQLDGGTHTVFVTEKYILIPDMPFQMGLTTILGLKVPPRNPYPKTQLHIVDRDDLKPGVKKVASRLATFPGDSFHFVNNYRHIDGEIRFFAVQLSTTSLTEAIEPGDINHFTGKPFTPDYYGIPWMFSFDPGTMRKVAIKVDCPESQTQAEKFVHPGWWATALFTADPREQFTEQGYSAIYQGYLGFPRNLISRRQYLQFRDDTNRLLQDTELPKTDLPSVLACLPHDKNWDELSEKLEVEKRTNPDTPLAHLGEDKLDFYVFEPGEILDGIQFIPEGDGYIFTTILTGNVYEAWLFEAKDLRKGPIAKVNLPDGVHFGFTLHSEYYPYLDQSRPDYKINRLWSLLRNMTLGVFKALMEGINIIRLILFPRSR